jgi:KUP system potassium uptake protein
MMIATVALTAIFASSERLAGAYGTAVSTTMLMTTVLLYNVMRERWHWPWQASVAVLGIFLVVDAAFCGANLLKIVEGGWIPLAFGTLVFIIMTTWGFGVHALRHEQAAQTHTAETFFERLRQQNIARVPGTGIFLTRASRTIPPIIVHHVDYMRALPQSVLL